MCLPIMQMLRLGVDYGRKKIGLALSEDSLAEPYKVIRFKSKEEVIKKIGQVVKLAQVGQVVMGISEGKMGKESRQFGEKLEKRLGVPVVFQDETLTTKEAESLSIKAGVKRTKRKSFRDAYSAALILQEYLDTHS